MDPLYQAMQDEFNRVAGTDNWRLHETPKLAADDFDKLLGVFGVGNYRVMAGSTGNFRITPEGKSAACGRWKRASILISPEAVRNAQQYAQATEALNIQRDRPRTAVEPISADNSELEPDEQGNRNSSPDRQGGADREVGGRAALLTSSDECGECDVRRRIVQADQVSEGGGEGGNVLSALAAQAIEAAAADETRSGSAEGESAVPEGMRP